MNAKKIKALEKSLNFQLKVLNEGILSDQKDFHELSGDRNADTSDTAQEEIKSIFAECFRHILN